MPSMDLTAAEDILKTDYQDGLRDQLNEINVVWAQFDKRKTPHRGKDFYLALRTGRNQGTGFRAENGTLPVPGGQQYDNAIYPQRYQYTRIRLTGQVIEQSIGDKAAFATALDSEINGAVDDTARDTNRVMWNDQSGIMTTLPGNAAATSVDVDSTKFLRIGQNVGLQTITTGVANAGVASGGWIVAVDQAGLTCDIALTDGGAAASLTPLVTEAIYRFGSRNLEANGLANIVNNTGTLGGINRATAGNDFWQSRIVDHSGDTLSGNFEDYLEEAMDEQDIHGSGNVNFIVMSHAYRRAFASELQGIRRFTQMAAVDLKGGFKGLDFNGTPVSNDRDASGAGGIPWTGAATATKGSAYLLDLNHIFVMQTDEYKWIDYDGHILYRASGGDVDAVEGTFRKFFNVGTDRGNALVALKLNTI